MKNEIWESDKTGREREEDADERLRAGISNRRRAARRRKEMG